MKEVAGSQRTFPVSTHRFITCRPVNPCTKPGSIESTELLGKQGSKNTGENIPCSSSRHTRVTSFVMYASRAICYQRSWSFEDKY
jgi:hypothetical protein